MGRNTEYIFSFPEVIFQNQLGTFLNLTAMRSASRIRDMPSLKIAHLNQQGQNMIIIPLDSAFGHKAQNEQREVIEELQMRSQSAGLAGTVVPVWDNGGGRMAFIAPHPWRSFFASLNLRAVYSNLNKELHW